MKTNVDTTMDTTAQGCRHGLINHLCALLPSSVPSRVHNHVPNDAVYLSPTWWMPAETEHNIAIVSKLLTMKDIASSLPFQESPKRQKYMSQRRFKQHRLFTARVASPMASAPTRFLLVLTLCGFIGPSGSHALGVPDLYPRGLPQTRMGCRSQLAL